MSKLEDELKKVIEQDVNSMSIFINRKLKVLFKNKNKKELIEFLPIIIENTNEYNQNWIENCSSLSKIKEFTDIFIDNLDKFKYSECDSLFSSITMQIQEFNLTEEQKLEIIEKFSNRDDLYDDYEIERLSSILSSDNSENEKYKRYILEKYIENENSCNACIKICLYNEEYYDIFFDNFNYIIDNIKNIDYWELKLMIMINEQGLRNSKYDLDNVIKKVKNKIEENKKEIIVKEIINIYDMINYNYEMDKLNDKDRKKIETIIEIIYMLIEDIAKNENVNMSDINELSNGGFSYPFEIGNKVIKIGKKRMVKTFPNNPYIISPLLRKEFSINDNVSLFVEVTEKVDTKSDISIEELYQLYKKIRNLNLIWVDIKNANVGRLLKDNIINWQEDLPINDERLGLEQYRGSEILKKGDIVILDNDFIFDDKELVWDINNKIYRMMGNREKAFEHRYQEEKSKVKENLEKNIEQLEIRNFSFIEEQQTEKLTERKK